MKNRIDRRHFIRKSAVLGASLAAWDRSPLVAVTASPANKIRVAVMGLNSRGMDHIKAFLALTDVEIAYICDVDDRAIAKGLKAIGDRQSSAPKGVKDFRKILDDRDVDALSIAAPNHWHAPATILACAAGKHVYVEKPGSHNPREGEMMVAAARKYKRFVQMGNQRRSWPWVIEAMAKVREGEIGRVTFARCWYNNSRSSIGRGKQTPVPEWLDYSLWQGPAPERPYKDNLIHYNWHWHWHWGNGELGNNGIHALDLARWGLGVDSPRIVSCGGGRYMFDDDQETPDIYVTTFDFGGKGAVWESHSHHPRGFEGSGFGTAFYGDKGSMVMAGNGYKIYDPKSKELYTYKSDWNDANHFGNFVDAIRGVGRLNSEIEEAQKSTLLCHLGNIAYRTGRTLHLDPENHQLLNDKKAMSLWGREYRSGWEPKV